MPGAHPELAAVPDIVSLQRHQPVAAAAASIIPIEAGGPGIKMTYMPLWAGGSLSQTKPIIDLSH